MTDFLPFLGIFGDEFILEMPEDAPYTLALAYLGDMPNYQCIASCRKRNGRAPTLYEMELFELEVDSILSRPPVDNSGMAFDTIPKQFPITLDIRDWQLASFYNPSQSYTPNNFVQRSALLGFYSSLTYGNQDTSVVRSSFSASFDLNDYEEPYNNSCFCVGTILNE